MADTPTPIDPNDALADLEASFSDQGEPADLLVIEQPPPPIGLSWGFDFVRSRFVSGGSGPLEVHGDATLIEWCEMTLRTARGAHPIFPPSYGLVRPNSLIGENLAGAPIAELEARIRDALTFRPEITDIDDFDWDVDDDAEAVVISFTIVRNDDTRLPVQTVLPLSPTQLVAS